MLHSTARRSPRRNRFSSCRPKPESPKAIPRTGSGTVSPSSSTPLNWDSVLVEVFLDLLPVTRLCERELKQEAGLFRWQIVPVNHFGYGAARAILHTAAVDAG